MPVVAKKKAVAVVVRNLPVDIHQRLKLRAREHGVSTEAEIRAILKDAVLPEKRVTPADLLVAFGKKWGPLPFVKSTDPAEPAEFE